MMIAPRPIDHLFDSIWVVQYRFSSERVDLYFGSLLRLRQYGWELVSIDIIIEISVKICHQNLDVRYYWTKIRTATTQNIRNNMFSGVRNWSVGWTGKFFTHRPYTTIFPMIVFQLLTDRSHVPSIIENLLIIRWNVVGFSFTSFEWESSAISDPVTSIKASDVVVRLCVSHSSHSYYWWRAIDHNYRNTIVIYATFLGA